MRSIRRLYSIVGYTLWAVICIGSNIKPVSTKTLIMALGCLVFAACFEILNAIEKDK